MAILDIPRHREVAVGQAGDRREYLSARERCSRCDRRANGTDRRSDSGTLKVPIAKVDALINLVGELVITQAMLAQTSTKIDLTKHQQLVSGLADLERHTRDLQESVMSIRMIPMSMVYSRFPRMLRDLAAKLKHDWAPPDFSPAFTAADLQNLGAYTAAVKILARGLELAPFSARTVLPERPAVPASPAAR